MPCEKHSPRASVTTKTSAFGLGFCLLSPSGHVFHTAWETMMKSYNTFRLLRHPCPMPWWHRCSVKESLSSTHWTSTFAPLFFDPLLPPTTSAILILKSPIITIHFPWLALNSIKFPISSTTQSCLASKLFTLCHRYTTTYFPSTNTSTVNPRFLPPLNI